MAKGTRTKKVKPEELVTETETKIETPVETPTEEVKEEAVVEDTSEPEVEGETPQSEPEKPVEATAPIIEEVVDATVTKEKLYEYAKAAPKQDEGETMEQKIVRFLESRIGGFVRINDFIKSLYPIPRMNEMPVYVNQGESKRLKGMLEKMKSDGTIKIEADSHLRLGSFYYPDGQTLKTHYHNINTIEIRCGL